MLDFCQSKKRILPLIAAALGVLAVPSQAWDEDEVKEHMKPFLGGYLGVYQIGEEDLDYAVAGPNDFNDFMPVGGVSLGIAYKRIHTGLQVGYQLLDASPVQTDRDGDGDADYYPKYKYDATPIEGFAELSVLPGRMPVNLLIGGSFGVALVRIQQPAKGWSVATSDTSVEYTFDNNDFDLANFMTGTAYAGARINIYNTLILQGQVGWRMLKSDGVTIEATGDHWGYESGFVVSGSGDSIRTTSTIDSRRFDLSGAFARVDLRWAFSSQFEKDQRSTDRERISRGERMALAEVRRVSQN